MRINFNNVYFPKPLLNRNSTDFVDNGFDVKIIDHNHNKAEEKLSIKIECNLNNEELKKLISSNKVMPVLHLEQKTIREVIKLEIDSITEKEIDLNNYATNDSIEVIGILVCKENLEFKKVSELNELYKLLGDSYNYSKGDVIGFSNELLIDLPEDRRVSSIFHLIPDTQNTLGDVPFNTILSRELITINMNKDLYEKYMEIIGKEPNSKKLLYSSIIYPALLTTLSEMFWGYDNYKESKWCKTISRKIEMEKKEKAEELFSEREYDMVNLYEYANIITGSLFEDAIDKYHYGLNGGEESE